jgi:hypothetical protein
VRIGGDTSLRDIAFEAAAPTRALEALGYRLSGQHYEHAESRFLLELPPGPLAIGADLITSWDTLRRPSGC